MHCYKSDPRPLPTPSWLPSSVLPSRIPTAPIAAKPHPCRPPLTSGPAGMRAGPPAILLDRNAGDKATPAGLLASELHPRCQAESLLPPSPPAGVQPFWSNSALCGPSVASSPISRPRCAGGQCMEKVLTLLHLGSKAPNRTYPFGSLASSSSPPGPGIFRLGILPSLLQSKCFVIQAGDILSRLEPKSLLPVPPPWVDVA
jgi:hypothetical protein